MSIQIITKKLSKLIGVYPSRLTMGDMRSQMSIDLLKSLTTVIERKANHPRVYYILVHSKIDHSVRGGHVVKERLICLDRHPSTPLLGTILFKIDNQLGDAIMEYCLPMDIPGLVMIDSSPSRFNAKPGVISIADSAKGLPIFNSKLN